MDASLADVVAALRAGGVVAYPTEAVYGLGCDPRNRNAFERLFAIKRRPPTQGVLLIAADFADLAPFIDESAVPPAAHGARAATWPGPHTWIFPRSAAAPAWLAGAHAGIARARDRACACSRAVPRVRRRPRLDQRKPPRRAAGAYRGRGPGRCSATKLTRY